MKILTLQPAVLMCFFWFSVITNNQALAASSAPYEGCYTDSVTRALPDELMPTGATVENCVAAAKSKGYAYAGVQGGEQCFGGNNLNYSPTTNTNNSNCNIKCKAEPSEYCGGSWFNSIYATGNAVSTISTINWDTEYQIIDGFGAADTGNAITSAQIEQLFSPTTGIGLSLLRTEVPDDGSCTTVNATCAGSVVSHMEIAISYGAKVWSTPWSPPASMKTNDNVDNGGSLLPASYGPYASYLSNYIKSLSSFHGINLYALSIQNEPNYSQSYASAVWTGQNFHDFILNNLGPTLANNGQSNVRVMLPENSKWETFIAGDSTAAITMADPAAAAYVGINAWHDYDDALSISNPFTANKKGFWETEASAGVGYGPSLCGGCWDPSIADALMWGQIIDNRLAVGGANAWHYWWLVNANSGDNEGLINSSGVVSKRMYMIGNYAKFIRPGFYRIGATHIPQVGILVSAYKNSTTGAMVIVVLNLNGSSVSQTFSLGGATAANVTPWITSAGFDLAEQSRVLFNNGTFTYKLPEYSITTFVGTTK